MSTNNQNSNDKINSSSAKGRETFALDRSLDYFTEKELTKQMGYGKGEWVLALAKELIDNALDHCEEKSIPPRVVIEITPNSLSVSDNGNGIPPETVSALLNPARRVSSRAIYRCPTRGAQGNAGKCLLGCACLLNGGNGRLKIIGAGVRHDIGICIDRLAQQPRIDHVRSSDKVHSGTLIELELCEDPCTLANGANRFVLLCESYAALNPHLDLHLSIAPDE